MGLTANIKDMIRPRWKRAERAGAPSQAAASAIGLPALVPGFILKSPVKTAAALLLTLYFAVAVHSIVHFEGTYDEWDHWKYGSNILDGDSERFDDSKMPVSVWNAWPRRLAAASSLPEGKLRDTLTWFFAARVPTILAALLLGWLVFRWARELYGERAGLLALSLFAIDANLLAHARLVTTDLYAALGVTLALYCFWRFQRDGGLRAGARSAFSLGFAQICKYSSVFLVPLFGILLLVRRWRELTGPGGGNRPWFARLRPKAALGYGALFLVAVLLVINAAYLFHRSFTPIGEYEFRSEQFKFLQQKLPAALLVPVPYPYLEGLDWVRERERQGSVFGGLYMLGELRMGRGFDTYYFVAYLFKAPLSIQILFIAAAVLYWKRRRMFHFSRDEAFLLIPVLFFFIYFNFLFEAHTGIRFLLVAFPLMHVFTASLFAPGAEPGKRGRRAIGALLLAGAVSVLSYHPHYLSYFNELVPDRKLAYQILADSNLDWGGNGYWYARWIEEHPEAASDPEYPVTGAIIVGANAYVGIAADGFLDWVRALGKEPVGHVAYSHLIFEITPEDLERLPAYMRR